MKKKYTVMDGNTAAAHVAYAFTEVAIYPITPSSPMAEEGGRMGGKRKRNHSGSPVDVIQMQSEAGGRHLLMVPYRQGR